MKQTTRNTLPPSQTHSEPHPLRSTDIHNQNLLPTPSHTHSKPPHTTPTPSALQFLTWCHAYIVCGRALLLVLAGLLLLLVGVSPGILSLGATIFQDGAQSHHITSHRGDIRRQDLPAQQGQLSHHFLSWKDKRVRGRRYQAFGQIEMAAK